MTALVEGGSAAWIQMSGQVVTVGPVDLTRTVVRRLTELVQGWLPRASHRPRIGESRWGRIQPAHRTFSPPELGTDSNDRNRRRSSIGQH